MDSDESSAVAVRDGVLDPADPRPEVRARVHAWLALQRHAALQPARARVLLADRADPVSALAALAGRSPSQALRSGELEAVRAALAGVLLVPFGAAVYPGRFAELADAPPLLAVRGDPAHLASPFVAIVGARAPTKLGLAVARRLASELAERGLGVVSGLARGIDAAAHRGALAARGVTVAMLGCGPDRVYPPEHAALAAAIAAAGAVVSELPVGAPPARHHFPLRNRLISALSRAVVVVEARPRSGSLVTVRHALDQGREVLAVPGSVDAPTSQGPNELLRAGAWPVLDASDVLAAIGIGPATPRERGGGPRPHAPAPPDAEGTDPILRALRHEPATRDELAARLRVGARELAQRLLPLQLAGRVVEERDGRLRVARNA